MKCLTFLCCLFLIFDVSALTVPTLKAYPSDSDLNINNIKKNKVLVFLSRTCPCTQQNIPYINELAKSFPDIEFIGIHSVKNGTTKDIQEIIDIYKPTFSVVDDHDLKIANLLKANRTPQAFIMNEQNEILYSGGVTDRTNPKTAGKLYLKNALTEVVAHQTVTEKETRSLGCIILR